MFSVMKNCFSDTPDSGTATVVFYNKCNMKCPYCYNYNNFENMQMSLEQVKEILRDNLGINRKTSETFLKDDWIILSGGEFLSLDMKSIKTIISDILATGAKIGLYTNGSYPDKLKEIIDSIDYVSLDYKDNCVNEYLTITDKIFENWHKTLEILKNSKVQFELKTTCIRQIHTKEKIQDMKGYISKLVDLNKTKWILQDFKDYNCLDKSMTHENSFVDTKILKTVLN